MARIYKQYFSSCFFFFFYPAPGVLKLISLLPARPIGKITCYLPGRPVGKITSHLPARARSGPFENSSLICRPDPGPWRPLAGTNWSYDAIFMYGQRKYNMYQCMITRLERWNILPTFGTRFHHDSIIEICFTIE